MIKPWGRYRKILFAFGIVLAFTFSTSCQTKKSTSSSSPDDGLTTGTLLTSMSNALNVPTCGGSSRNEELYSRPTSSRAGCEAINATRRMKAAVQRAKADLCMFGKLETASVISRPSSGYNYYQLTHSGTTYKLRYGLTSDNKLQINGCVDSTARWEIFQERDGTSATITVTDSFIGHGGSTSSKHQLVVKATIENSAYTFNSSTANVGGGTFTGYISVTKGTPTKVTQRYTDGTTVRTVYTEFDSSQGASKARITVSGSNTDFHDSWTNDSTYACISPSSSGTYYSNVSSFDPTTVTTGATPSYVNTWDCTVPDGSSITTVTAAQLISVLTDIAACLTNNPIVTEIDCGGSGIGGC